MFITVSFYNMTFISSIYNSEKLQKETCFELPNYFEDFKYLKTSDLYLFSFVAKKNLN